MYWQSEKNLLNSNIACTCPQCGELRPTNVWDRLASLGHPKNFSGCLDFVTTPTSLNRGQPNFARCLAVLWAGTICIYFLGTLAPLRNFARCKIHLFTLHLSLAFSYIGSVTARHSSNGHLPNFAVCCKEWNYGTFTDGAIYMAGWPSRWASAHVSILCCSTFLLIGECVLLLWQVQFFHIKPRNWLDERLRNDLFCVE